MEVDPAVFPPGKSAFLQNPQMVEHSESRKPQRTRQFEVGLWAGLQSLGKGNAPGIGKSEGDSANFSVSFRRIGGQGECQCFQQRRC